MKEKQKKLNRKEVKEQLDKIIHLFHKKLKVKKINTLSKAENDIAKEKKTDSLQELIDYLRVSVKYKIFEVEALQREVSYLKKLLEDNGVKL